MMEVGTPGKNEKRAITVFACRYLQVKGFFLRPIHMTCLIVHQKG